MTYRWTWIRNSGNSTDYYNEAEFLDGHVFWFVDNITGKYYNIKKDSTGKIMFSNDFFHDINRYKIQTAFLNWIKITAPDLDQKDISAFFEPESEKVVVHQSATDSSPYTKPIEIPPKQPEPNKKTLKNLRFPNPKTDCPKESIHDVCNKLIANPKYYFMLTERDFSEEMANIILGKFGLSSDDALNVVKRWFEIRCSESNHESGPLTLRELMLLGLPVNIIPKFISGKYNNGLLGRYINANDTAKDDIASLEDDFYFMMDVINLSGDKRMFHFCSENLKTSFEMVWFMINRFSNEMEFLFKIVDAYLSKKTSLEERLAIFQLMKSLDYDINRFRAKF